MAGSWTDYDPEAVRRQNMHCLEVIKNLNKSRVKSKPKTRVNKDCQIEIDMLVTCFGKDQVQEALSRSKKND
jgi:hypothetical protein